MAYKNLINISCASKAEFFCRMRDFICARNGTYDYSATGIGWTLHDFSYAVDEDTPQLNDWFVIKSEGESGKESMYFKLVWVNNYISVYGYLFWDNSSHSGATAFGSGPNTLRMYDSFTSLTMWIYGDFDYFSIISFYNETTYYGTSMGKLEKPYNYLDETISTCSSALTAGSDVSIILDAVPSSWEVGSEIFIWCANLKTTTRIEKTTIKTINGNTITADLSNSYDSVVRISNHIGYAQMTGDDFDYYHSTVIGRNGTKPTVCYSDRLKTLDSWFDPDSMDGVYGATPMFVGYSTWGLIGVMPNMLFMSASGLTSDVLYEDKITGVNYRYFLMYNACGAL